MYIQEAFFLTKAVKWAPFKLSPVAEVEGKKVERETTESSDAQNVSI